MNLFDFSDLIICSGTELLVGGRRRRCDQSHFLLQCEKLSVRRRVARCCLELLEITRQAVT